MVGQNLYIKIRKIVGSELFFFCILGVFLFSALWIVFTARYPMAFDENYHYGIIKVYSHQLSPFIAHAPSGTESFGDITRYPSYLFHYLMSFPYRLISLFTDFDQTKIIALRLINVGLFMVGLVYFRKLLLLSRAGKALTNITLLFFVLIPNVIFLAAHINYDNLLVLVTALVLYLCLKFIYAAKKGKYETGLFVWITILNLLTSLVIYTYLPIFFATQLFVTGYALFAARKRPKALTKSLAATFRAQKPVARWVGVAILVLSLGLFAERYGINQIKYSNLIPDCGQILPQSSCMQYGPWGRDFKLVQTAPSTWSDGRYFFQWAGQTMYELFFTINYNYANKGPLPLPFVTAWVVTVSGFVLAIFNWRKIKENVAFVFLAVVIVVFGISLWFNNLNRFHRVGAPVAIHGRYWVQLLPVVMFFGLLGIKLTVDRLPNHIRYPFASSLLIAATILFLQGGGISSYILSSDSSWYWPDQNVTSANNSARKLLEPVVIH